MRWVHVIVRYDDRGREFAEFLRNALRLTAVAFVHTFLSIRGFREVRLGS